jgi:hypothetical protein
VSEAVLCDCGNVLVEGVTKEGVVPIGGEPIVFRRDTDYVVCSNCHKVYRAKMLLAGASLADSVVAGGADADDAIAKLEKLLEDE